MRNKRFSPLTWPTRVLNGLLRGAIRFYRAIRAAILDPLLYSAFGVVSECRYQESCSHYAERMLQEHATIPALGKIVRRIWSCHT